METQLTTQYSLFAVLMQTLAETLWYDCVLLVPAEVAGLDGLMKCKALRTE